MSFVVLLNDLISPANGAVAALLRSRFHRPASTSLMLVGWEGRKTGKRYSIPVGYQQHGDATVVLISKPGEKTWWRNFRSRWPAELRLRGESRTATGLVIGTDEPEFYEHCETTLKRLPWVGSQFGITYDKTTGLTDAQCDSLRQAVAVVRFDLVPEDAGEAPRRQGSEP